MRLSTLGRVVVYAALGAMYGAAFVVVLVASAWPWRRLDTERREP